MIRMMLAASLCLAAMPLAGCAGRVELPQPGTEAPAPDPVAAAIDTADLTIAVVSERYEAAKRLVGLFLPLASPARQAEVLAIEAKIDNAILTARFASNAAAQIAALRRAQTAISDLRGAP